MTTTTIQKRFADLDILGHVNNVNLQHYFDVGKTDFFRHVLGTEAHDPEAGMITASTSTSYLEQTRWEDEMRVETGIEKLGNKSLTVFQQLINAATGKVHAESRSVMVAYDFGAQQSIELPEWWREALKPHVV